jgi:hydroxymethylpyrimidine pyrophosphatase-like HAD family hydrolase
LSVVIPDTRPVSALDPSVMHEFREFHHTSNFLHRGAVVTDLDGTAVHEREGRVFVAEAVAEGLKALTDLGRPVVLNTLRFPLNVVNTFGRAWSAITEAPLPLISLNGSVLGHLAATDAGEATFKEVTSHPIPDDEIAGAVSTLGRLLEDGIEDVVLFHYPRDWRLGESTWTARPETAAHLQEKYRTASSVASTPLELLHENLQSEGVCMMSLLVDVPEDRRMAYQHANPNRFITAPGVDKLSGARAAAARFAFDLDQSVGAGDTPMDTFLSGVGLAFHVGPMVLDFKGLRATVRPRDSALFALATFQRKSA